MNMFWIFLTLLAVLGGEVNAQNYGDAGGASTAIPATALKADQWVIPPTNSAEIKDRLVAIRKQYAPFLRSLPPKPEVRHRQSLNGEWQSKFEVRDSLTGVVPPTPNWFTPDLDEKAAGWESRTVPEWPWKRPPHRLYFARLRLHQEQPVTLSKSKIYSFHSLSTMSKN